MSLKVATIRKIPIRLHFTLIIVFFLISWTLAVGIMPQFYPYLTSFDYWIVGISGAGILFISVLLHELAHSILSLKYGLGVRQILLFIFGGVSDIEEETKDFRKEFKIAVVGPLTSFALAGLFILIEFLISFLTGKSNMTFLDFIISSGNIVINSGQGDYFRILTIIEAVARYASTINLLLGIFNLIPAFPLDGGRILRSFLVKLKKDYFQATKISVQIGIGISYGIIFFGFISILNGAFIGGFWLIIIGWFINSGAQAYWQQQEISKALEGLKLKDIMNTNFIAVEQDISLKELIDNYFNVYRKSAFPVLDTNGRLVGMISTNELLDYQYKDKKLSEKKVNEIMIPFSELLIMDPENEVNNALPQLIKKGTSRIYIDDDNRKLIGIISKSDILNVAKEKQEYMKLSRGFIDR